MAVDEIQELFFCPACRRDLEPSIVATFDFELDVPLHLPLAFSGFMDMCTNPNNMILQAHVRMSYVSYRMFI